jgi:hypothetical protein
MLNQPFNNRLKIRLDKEKFFFKMLILCQYPALFLQPLKDILPPKTSNLVYESL